MKKNRWYREGSKADGWIYFKKHPTRKNGVKFDKYFRTEYQTKGRRIAILGDMKELGPQERSLHASLAQLEATQRLDVVHCIGPLMKALYDQLPEHQRGLWAETSADLTGRLRPLLDSGDVVLAKGSLSMRLAVIVDAIRKMGHPEPAA